MIVAGVDPGLTGGVAVFCTIRAALVAAHAMPVFDVSKGQRSVNAAALRGLLAGALPDYVVIERVAARPGQGVSSMFSFGRSLGIVEGVCGGLLLPTLMLTPQGWRGKVGLRGDKGDARALATRTWPAHAAAFARVKDDGLAEAALIAWAGAKLLMETRT